MSCLQTMQGNESEATSAATMSEAFAAVTATTKPLVFEPAIAVVKAVRTPTVCAEENSSMNKPRTIETEPETKLHDLNDGSDKDKDQQ